MIPSAEVFRIDRPVREQRIPSFPNPGSDLRHDLNDVAAKARHAFSLGDELLGDSPGCGSIDCQRDVLHLRARIEAVARQIDDAILTLDRIEERHPGTTVAGLTIHVRSDADRPA